MNDRGTCMAIAACTIFSALHGMPARTSDEKGVRLAVCHRTLPLSHPKGGSKTQNGRFPSKIALEESLLQSCVKIVSDEVVRHSFA